MLGTGWNNCKLKDFWKVLFYILFGAPVGFSSYVSEVVQLLDSSSEDEYQVRASTSTVSEPQSDAVDTGK